MRSLITIIWFLTLLLYCDYIFDFKNIYDIILIEYESTHIMENFQDTLYSRPLFAENEVILLTDAYSKLGKGILYHLLSLNCYLILTVNSTFLEDIKTESQKRYDILAKVTLYPTNLNSLSSVNEFVKFLEKESIKIDYLINSPNIVFLTNDYTIDGFEETIAANFIIPAHLTLSLCEKQILNDNTKITFIGSEIHRSASPLDKNKDKYFTFNNSLMNYWQNYQRSKLSLITWIHELNRRYNSKYKIRCICYGYIDFNFNIISNFFQVDYSKKALPILWITFMEHRRNVNWFLHEPLLASENSRDLQNGKWIWESLQEVRKINR